MEIWQLLLIIGTLFTTLISFIWVALKLNTIHGNMADGGQNERPNEKINQVVNQAFTDDFREELRNRARQQFEKLIHENAMFLQQDVRVSAAQLDDFMKKEVIATLQQELAKHHESIAQTKDMVTTSLSQTKQQFERDLKDEKERKLKDFDENLQEIVKGYVQKAVGDVINSEKELALIIDGLQAKKAEIFEDIRRNA